MDRDIQRYVRVIDTMRPQLEAFTRTHDLIATMDFGIAALEIQRYQDEVGRILSLANHTAGYTDLLKSAAGLHELSLSISAGLKDSIDQVHRSWFLEWQDAIIPFDQIEAIAKQMLSDVAYSAAVVKPIWDGIDFDVIGQQLRIQQSIMSQVQQSMSAFMTSYRMLSESFRGIDNLIELPSFVLPGATQEIAMTGHALDVRYTVEDETQEEAAELEPYSVAEEELEDSDLIALLERVGPQFVTTYRGAVATLDGDNPDRSRHVLTSFRELWNHLLRRLAPKKEVEDWIQKHSIQGYLHDGQPTRHAKIRYVLRDLGDESLRDFVEADARAMVELYALYGRLHGLDTGVADEQLRAIAFRTESYLSYILRVREWSIE